MESKNTVSSKFTFMVSVHSRRYLKIGCVLLVTILALLCAYFVFGLGKTHSTSESSYFTIVLDCGSTGTRVNVYEWLSNSTSNKEQPVLLNSFPDHSTNNSLHKEACIYHCMQTEPGLDKFVGNVSGVREALEPLLQWAEQHIPSERHRDSSVFLLATAGLRRLPIQDAAWLLENAEVIVKKYPFLYKKKWIRVLTGKEEAYYGWLALNYKMETLKASTQLATFGVLDLGGSSLQVVVETDDLRQNENSLPLRIGPLEHQILAYSLPKFGLNEAFARTVVMLSEEQSLTEGTNGKFNLKHPCLSLGFLMNYTCYGCFQANLSNPNTLRSPLQGNGSTSFYLTGDPDWEQCKRISKAAATHSSNSDLLHLTEVMNCKERSSSSSSANSSNSIRSPRLVSRFHALSGFFAVYSMLDLSPRANLTKVWERGKQICSGSWLVSKRFSRNRKYADQFCFRVPYLASLLEDSLCTSGAEIIFGPGDVSWTLGAGLAEGAHIWLSNTEPQADSYNLKILKVFSSPISLFVAFFCFLLIIYRDRAKRTAILLTSMMGKKGASIGASLPAYFCTKRQLN